MGREGVRLGVRACLCRFVMLATAATALEMTRLAYSSSCSYDSGTYEGWVAVRIVARLFRRCDETQLIPHRTLLVS